MRQVENSVFDLRQGFALLRENVEKLTGPDQRGCIYLWPEEELDTVDVRPVEEGGGVADQDPGERLVRDPGDRGAHLLLRVIREPVPAN